MISFLKSVIDETISFVLISFLQCLETCFPALLPPLFFLAIHRPFHYFPFEIRRPCGRLNEYRYSAVFRLGFPIDWFFVLSSSFSRRHYPPSFPLSSLTLPVLPFFVFYCCVRLPLDEIFDNLLFNFRSNTFIVNFDCRSGSFSRVL